MYGWVDLKEKIIRGFWFTRDEWKTFYISVAVTGLIIASGMQVNESRLVLSLIGNLCGGLLIAIIIHFVHDAGRRIATLQFGFTPKRELWWPGLVVGVIVAIFSKGHLWFIASSGLTVTLDPKHRIGYWRYGLNLFESSMGAMAGPATLVIFAVILKFIQLGIESSFLLLLTRAALILAVLSMLPIPPLDGSRVFWSSRLIYMFTAGISLGCAIILWWPYTKLIYLLLAIIGCLLFGVLAWFSWLQGAEGGPDKYK